MYAYVVLVCCIWIPKNNGIKTFKYIPAFHGITLNVQICDQKNKTCIQKVNTEINTLNIN